MSKDYYLLLTEDGLPVGSSITPNFPMLELPKCKVMQVVDKLEYDKVQEELGELDAEIIALKAQLDLAKSALNQMATGKYSNVGGACSCPNVALDLARYLENE